MASTPASFPLPMGTSEAVRLFDALASAVRLDIYRLLVRQGPQGLVAGEISATLGLPPTNLSFHLKALAQSGLVVSAPEGRFVRYRADIPLMQSLMAYLTDECCGGHPEICAAPPRCPC